MHPVKDVEHICNLISCLKMKVNIVERFAYKPIAYFAGALAIGDSQFMLHFNCTLAGNILNIFKLNCFTIYIGSV